MKVQELKEYLYDADDWDDIRVKHNDETGNIELVDDDERDLFSGLGGDN